MRLSQRKVFTLFIVVCLSFLLPLNLYHRNLWSHQTDSLRLDYEAEEINDPSHSKGRKHVLPIEHVDKMLSQELTQKPGRAFISPSGVVPPPNQTQTKAPVYWPDLAEYDDDRIVAQLQFRPKWFAWRTVNVLTPLKTILLYHGQRSMNAKPGQEQFKQNNCLIDACSITYNRDLGNVADAVLFKNSFTKPLMKRPPHQIWILYLLESPYHTPAYKNCKNSLNWTATYRRDSDIVAPYEKFQLYDEAVRTLPQNQSYASGKTKKVAWFVSNCATKNKRMDYAKALSKYITVDIYGRCGLLKCPRSQEKCFDMLNTDYKFYLAFENSNCRDYITEKFFVTGLMHDVIPIAMGAAPEDYRRAAPAHSFIHVDDFSSPRKLAEYLHKLDQNDDLYNEYFAWKGTGRFINTFFWCRLCAMLHEPNRQPSTYRDFDKWWRGDQICIGSDPWWKHPRKSKHVVEDYLQKF